jgi:hypothetical protein
VPYLLRNKGGEKNKQYNQKGFYMSGNLENNTGLVIIRKSLSSIFFMISPTVAKVIQYFLLLKNIVCRKRTGEYQFYPVEFPQK